MQTNLSDIEQGELIVADIMFAEQTGSKRRLALVVSNTTFNANSTDIVTLKVTSKNKHKTFDIAVTNENTIKKMLKKASAIRVDFPVTIAKEKIISRPDKIDKEKLSEVKQKIKEFYEL